MASCFCKGRSVFFVFKNGVSQLDCQNRPRMYKSIEQFKGKFPNYGHEDVELVEYAPVVHGEWVWNTKGLFPKPLCSRCNHEPYRASNHNSDLPNYCPNCGAKMDGKAVE